ncbi:MAG: VOC family protein [Chloroflexi bacterium]|nr:VOC family protein [Chloroflexota bacterium]
MPEITSYEHGAPCWTDLATSEPERAKVFYSVLFGWTYQDNDMGGGQFYSMAQLNGLDAGAIYGQSAEEIEQGVPPRWSTYINVDDVDATAAKVAPLGGSLMMEPFDVMDVGRMALISDPTGAVVALWQFKAHMGARVVNEPGAMTWNELATGDTDAAEAFYTELLGWHSHVVDMGGFDYTIFHITHEHPAGGMVQLDESQAGVNSHWNVYFAVEDCDATTELAVDSGGRVVVPPTDIPPGRFAILADPQGAVFAVMRTNEELA